MDRTSPQERDFSSLTIASTPEKMLKAKQKIKAFRRRLAHYLEAGPEKTEVYRLSIQLFPISLNDTKKE